MKTIIKSSLKYIAVFVLIFPLQSCLDIFLTTEVHSDGSLTKTIVLEGDSTSILESYIPAVKNDSWEKEWLNIEDDKHKLVLSKTFKNDEEFNLDMNPADSTPAVRVTAKVKRKFRWFFSYIVYEELLLPNNPFQKLDWKDYLTEEEIELISLDEDEREDDPRFEEGDYSSTEDKLEDYIYRSAYEEFFQLFNSAIKTSKSSLMSVEEHEKQKENIYQHCYNETDFEEFEDLMEAYSQILGEKEVNSIIEENPQISAYYQQKLDFFNECFDDNYYFTINMPGLLIETNSDKIEAARLAWEVDFLDFYFKGLPMQAQSRIVNTWAFYVAGVFILLLLSALIWGVFRKRKAL